VPETELPASGPPPGTSTAVGMDPRDTTEVVTSVVARLQALVTKEIELAKLEAKQVITDKAIAAGTMAGAALLGLFILGFVGVTAAKALDLVVAEWLAWLIVTLIYTLLAGILAAVGIRKAKRPVMDQTKAEVETTKAWAKEQVNR
jgi:protein-S-isoprenylcysteine O-methyltransferase Ste14